MKKPLKSKKRICNKLWSMQPQEEQEKWWNQEEDPIWVTHYCSHHQILLVGDGDFSFSLSLAKAFASASNMVASSLDTYDEVIKKYKNAKSNLAELQNLGAYLLHGVNATQMNFHPDLKMRKFDRIIFNFPHAGFLLKEDDLMMIKMHMDVVFGFFKSASHMLRANGEIHVNHKTTHPYDKWNIQKLAEHSFLILIECADFKKEDYPGYNNKRGDSYRCDDPFPLGECSTFKFIHNPRSMKNHLRRNHMEVFRQHEILPFQEIKNMERLRAPDDLNYRPQRSLFPKINQLNHFPQTSLLPNTPELYHYPQTSLLPKMNQLDHYPQTSLFPKINRFDHFPQTSLVPNTPELYHYPQTSLLPKMNQLDHYPQTSLLPKINRLDHFPQTSLVPNTPKLYHYPQTSLLPKMNQLDHYPQTSLLPKNNRLDHFPQTSLVPNTPELYHYPQTSLFPKMNQLDHYPQTSLLPKTNQLDYYPQQSHFPKMNEPVRPEFDLRNGFNTIPRDYFNNVIERHGIVGSSADYYHFGYLSTILNI